MGEDEVIFDGELKLRSWHADKPWTTINITRLRLRPNSGVPTCGDSKQLLHHRPGRLTMINIWLHTHTRTHARTHARARTHTHTHLITFMICTYVYRVYYRILYDTVQYCMILYDTVRYCMILYDTFCISAFEPPGWTVTCLAEDRFLLVFIIGSTISSHSGSSPSCWCRACWCFWNQR